MALVVFLRGVNVGGHRAFRPSVLAKALERYGVVNIGAAGTFVVRRPPCRAKLLTELAERLPFTTLIMICEGREILDLELATFGEVPSGAVRFVSVMAKRPRRPPPTPIQLPAKGPWLVKGVAEGRFVFGLYRRHLKTIGYLGKLDTLLGAPVTTRNWNTISAIVKVLQAR